MPDTLCISVTFLDPRFHGRGDGDAAEWPPSPLRVFQAIVAANGDRLDETGWTSQALRWLEHRPAPTIISPGSVAGQRIPVYVPNNAMDLTAKKWARGDNSVPMSTAMASHKAMKPVQPTHLTDGQTVHYLWADCPDDTPWDAIQDAVSRIVALGWGIDMAVAQARRLEPDAILRGKRWQPHDTAHGNTLRLPIPGTLNALVHRHQHFLRRLDDAGFHPVPPLSSYRTAHYRRDDEPIPQAYRLFELRRLDGENYRHPPAKLIHVAGAARHLAIGQMKHARPNDVHENWVEVFVAGHARDDGNSHQQLAYLPLPSVGIKHTDPGIRRLMLAAPPEYEHHLDHLARRLAGQSLIPDPRYPDTFGADEQGNPLPPPLLVPIRPTGDGVTHSYTQAATTWHSFTPVILPGHDDKKPAKTLKLIETALAQAGVEQPCEFEWSAHSRFRRSYSAHKYDRSKKPQGYIRPNHLLSQTAVHLTVRFQRPVPGPLVIGAGRHCGFGLMAAIDSENT